MLYWPENNTMMNIQDIKKVELHCHVDQLLNQYILMGLQSIERYKKLITGLEQLCPIESIRDWVENYGAFIDPVVSNNGEFLLKLLELYLIKSKQQNVIYSEIMLSGFTFQHGDIDRQIELYKKFRESADKIGGDGYQIEFLIAIGRTTDRRKMELLLNRLLSVKEAGLICGVAVAGLEEENTVKPYTDIFSEFKNAGLGIEIHAGEWKGPEFIWEALEYGFADRIGHGLAAFEDPVLVKHIKENRIHLEFCPTSNLCLTKYKRIEDHPLKHALAEGISFSINTDDPGPLCCDINHEYELVQKTFGLTEKDFDTIRENSLRAAFMPTEE